LGRELFKVYVYLIEQLYKTVREAMKILSRNYFFFVDLSKIIQSFSIRAWMNNV